jgi:hypothetical protein
LEVLKVTPVVIWKLGHCHFYLLVTLNMAALLAHRRNNLPHKQWGGTRQMGGRRNEFLSPAALRLY